MAKGSPDYTSRIALSYIGRTADIRKHGTALDEIAAIYEVTASKELFITAVWLDVDNDDVAQYGTGAIGIYTSGDVLDSWILYVRLRAESHNTFWCPMTTPIKLAEDYYVALYSQNSDTLVVGGFHGFEDDA